MSNFNRRSFIRNVASVSAIAMIDPSEVLFKRNEESQLEKWQKMMTDPVYEMIKGKPDLDLILRLFVRQQGNPAFDPELIKENIKKVKPVPEVNTGHQFLDLSIKTGLAHIDATFQGDHPRYGTGVYSRPEHEGFPPIIIAAVDSLSAWGINTRAATLFNYWLTNFVKEDGTFNYYGPSISEYGQMLHTAKILEERAGGKGWMENGFVKLNLISEYLLRLASEALKDGKLISGVPEADTRDQAGIYFHNNAWVVRGLEQWADLCEKTSSAPSTSTGVIRKTARRLKEETLSAIRKTWPADPSDWWLTARVGDTNHPRYVTELNETSYTNYRYWPELLSSGILPDDMTNRLVNARLNGGGQFCGMTRFMNWLDDWPLTDYLYGLWRLGRKNDFLLSLYGHIAYSQCEGHLTAYEQFNFPGDPEGSKRADYCLPCQLVAARAGRLINLS